MQTAVKERPIHFSAEMVRAILAGRKTQTRRVVAKGNSACALPWDRLVWSDAEIADGCPYRTFTDYYVGGYLHVPGRPHPDDPQEGEHWTSHRVYPRWEIGQRLWVRESFYIDLLPWADGGSIRDIDVAEAMENIYHRADGECCQQIPECACAEVGKTKWRNARYMPRWASRITLELTDVRVERLQDISGRDAAAEGCEPDWEEFNDATCCEEGWEEPEELIEECEEELDCINYGHRLVHSSEHREWQRDRRDYALRLAFRALWDSISGTQHPWASNPWVWCLEFRKVGGEMQGIHCLAERSDTESAT